MFLLPKCNFQGHPMACLCRHRGISPPILNLGARWGGSSTSRPGRHYLGKDLVPIVPEACWASRRVWTGTKNLPCTVIRSPDRVGDNELIYLYAIPAGHHLYLTGNDLFQRYLLTKYLRCTECSLKETKKKVFCLVQKSRSYILCPIPKLNVT
jgi:hypothetical protein